MKQNRFIKSTKLLNNGESLTWFSFWKTQGVHCSWNRWDDDFYVFKMITVDGKELKTKFVDINLTKKIKAAQ
jgi:hypothetical protein